MIKLIKIFLHKILCHYGKHDEYWREEGDKTFLSCRWCTNEKDITVFANSIKTSMSSLIDMILPENINNIP